jgi:hypothetical protein
MGKIVSLGTLVYIVLPILIAAAVGFIAGSYF